MNITPTRLKLLRFLADRPHYYITGLADKIAPRDGGWSRQGAARWGHGYVAPMAKAGLIHVNKIVNMVSITRAGLKALADADAAQAKADLEAAIRSAK